MKTRQGFVSNSSSSSFILATPNKTKKVQVTIEVDLEDYGKEITTIKQLDEYYCDEYGYNRIQDFLDEEDYHSKSYNKAVDAINHGKSIWIGSVSNECCDNGLELYFFDNGFSSVTTHGVEIITDSAH